MLQAPSFFHCSSTPGTPLDNDCESTVASTNATKSVLLPPASANVEMCSLFPHVACFCIEVLCGSIWPVKLRSPACFLLVQEIEENPVSWTLLWGTRILNVEYFPLITRVFKKVKNLYRCWNAAQWSLILNDPSIHPFILYFNNIYWALAMRQGRCWESRCKNK